MEKGRIDMRRNALTWAAVFLICFSVVSGQVGNQAPRVTPGQQTLRVVKTAPVGTNITTLNAVDVDGPSPVNFFISDFATNQLVQLNSVPGSRSSIRVQLSSSLEAEPPSTKSLYIVASDGRSRTTATITLQVINPVSPMLTGLNTTGLLSNPPDVQAVVSNLRLLTETLCDLYTNQSPVSESLTRFRLFCLLFKAVYSQLPPSIFNPDDTTGTNNPPVFTSRASFTVREGLPAGYEIGQLIAVDDDGPEEITFNLRDSQNGQRFRLGNPSGQSSSGRFVMLYLRQSLDRQRTPREVLYVTAEDGQSTSTATVIVNVVSANNNPPMFVRRNTTFIIGNSSLPGLRIGSVFAIDRDSGNNGRVSYSFRTVNSSMQTFFSMNPSDGSIYLKRKLPGNRNVTLIVTAVDGGGMATTANVTVLVRASNENTSNACGNSTCMNGATCISRGNRNYTCSCRPGFTGVNCTYRNSTFGCLSNPCLNGATCLRGVNNSYRCYCRFGYTGYNCASKNTSNACGNSTCMNGATCISRGNRNYTCSCRPGFTGVNCTYRNSTFGCLSNPCLNGASCLRGVNNSYRCYCRFGYTGYNCASKNTSNACGNSTCMNGATCISRGNRNYTCSCRPGFTGVNCTYRNSTFGCLSNPCLNGATCLRGVNNSYRCYCRFGYTGYNCASKNTSNACGNNTCMNGATCISRGNRNYTCSCRPGFTGVNCTYRNSTFGCSSNPCLNGASCVRGVNNSYRCNCRSGYTGYNCASRNTSSPCGTCRNGGTCIRAISGGYTCNCLVGFSGDNCEYTEGTPRFMVRSTTVNVSEAAPIGTQLLRLNLLSPTQRVTVSSSDRTGTIRLRLTIVGSSASISVSLGRSLDRERVNRMNFTIFAYDGNYGDSTKLILNITDVNDEAPIFTSPVYIAVNKATPVGATLMIVNATDADAGQNGNVSYSIYGGTSGANRFRLNRTSGVLSVNGSLSTITADTVSLYIQAKDNGSPSLSTIATISIRLSNSAIPANSSLRFQPNVYSTSVPENSNRGSFLVQLALVDADQRLGGLAMSLRDPTNTVFANDFIINNNVTYISLRLNQTLDREVLTSKTVVVIAATKTPPLISATCTVNIQIVDVNDNRPVFESPRYTATVQSGIQVGSMVAAVSATDSDTGNAGQVFYRFTQRSTEFSINVNTGLITTQATLSRIANTVQTIAVLAQDNGTPPLSATAIVDIQVTGQPDDTGNTGPVFDRSQVNVIVRENLPANTVVTTLTARYSNAGQSISFIMEDDYNSLFTLQPTLTNTGSRIAIVANGPFDREISPRYLLKVIAMGGRQEATATVTVGVQDVNDNAPVFSQQLYITSIPASTPVSSIILQTQATDADIGNNGQVTYRKQTNTAQDLSGSFQVESSTGRVIIVASLANLAGRTVNFSVIATDDGTPAQLSTTNVTIRVISDGDNQSPVIQGVPTTIRVPENTPTGTILMLVLTSDLDGPNRVTLSLPDRESFDTVQIGGSINNETATLTRITLNTFLNRELEATKVFRIVASDGQNSVTSTVTIVIEDVNDNTPTFTSSSYSSTLSTSMGVGNSVLTVSATDPDQRENGTVQYSIQSSTAPGYFSVNQNTGVILVTNSLTSLDGQTVTLRVEARDRGLPLSLNASVLVRLRIQSSPVTVEDNVAPTFPQQVMTFTVRENNINGSYIGSIRSFDADGPEEVTMRIAGDTAFNGGYLVRSLLSQTGDNSLIYYLGINTVFDRERDPENNTVLLIASDGLAETTATVMIRVEDLNDNVPVFTLPTYTASVAESSPVNTIVIQLGASDADSGLFGEITYTMRSSDPIGSQAFRIDERTGTIMTSGLLSGRTGSLVLTVTATDGGRRPSTVDVNVTIV
ncbi:protocadherin-16-like isoform X2 [Haliotis rufescens]|uniref:protocadherin-16-like isoform X2 n=1 Tax=Haliotis rufescens TaxID=6454 RepID=UPI00201F2149|nr:protocadherin-16-like isoform X2 [Haliotis rufescens]